MQFNVKKLLRIGLACCDRIHTSCDTSKSTKSAYMVTGRRIKSYVNDLIIGNKYKIVFAAKIPLLDENEYQVCKTAYRDLANHEKNKKVVEEEKETVDIEEDNNPCQRSARLAAKRGIHDLNKIRLLEVPRCEDKDQQRAEFASIMLQEESDQLQLLEEDKVGDDEVEDDEEEE